MSLVHKLFSAGRVRDFHRGHSLNVASLPRCKYILSNHKIYINASASFFDDYAI